MGGGKSSDKQTTTMRYAPYFEMYHEQALKLTFDAYYTMPGQDDWTTPYSNYTNLSFSSELAGLMTDFQDMMENLDAGGLFNQAFIGVTSGSIIQTLVTEEAGILSDDIEAEALPRFETGLRDINSVISSSFVVGRALIEDARTKALSRFSADLRGKLIPAAIERWKTTLGWNKEVIDTYSNILKLEITAKMDIDNHNLEIAAKNALWWFNGLQYLFAALSASHGPYTTSTETSGSSKAAKAMGGALMGASAGAAVGGPIGAAIGGVVGLVSGLF